MCVATLPCEISVFKKSQFLRSKWSKLLCKTWPLKHCFKINVCRNKHYLLHWQKRCFHQPHKNHMTDCTQLPQQRKDVAAKCRTWSAVGQLLIASVCQSVSQNWSTAVWYLLIINSVNLPINIRTISNSLCPSYTSYSTYLARSASLRTKVQSEWGMWHSQPFCL